MQQTPKYYICSVKNLFKNPEWNEWYYLQYMVYLQKCNMMGMGEKTKYTKDETKEKDTPFGCPPIPPPVYKVVSENTENEPDLP